MSYTGNIGGRPAANAACAAEFTDAHVCHASEYNLSNSTATIPAGGVWMESSVAVDDAYTVAGLVMSGMNPSYSCDHWTHAGNSYSGTLLDWDGSIGTTSTCATPRPFVCCL